MVVPAYNEQGRLPASLSKIAGYLASQDYSWEVVVVDDGSTDSTAAVVEEFLRHRRAPGEIRLVRNPHYGKAYAVRSGVLAARGELIFLCDADLSTPIEEMARFLPPIQGGYDIAIGSREAPGARRYDEPLYRHLMGRAFNRVVRWLTGGPFQDTQCGFKMFRGVVARDLLARGQLYRGGGRPVRGPMVTGYDVEMLFLALKFGYRVAEVPVDWYYMAGSKVNPWKDTFRMLGDVLRVRLNDLRGRYDRPEA